MIAIMIMIRTRHTECLLNSFLFGFFFLTLPNEISLLAPRVGYTMDGNDDAYDPTQTVVSSVDSLIYLLAC